MKFACFNLVQAWILYIPAVILIDEVNYKFLFDLESGFKKMLVLHYIILSATIFIIFLAKKYETRITYRWMIWSLGYLTCVVVSPMTLKSSLLNPAAVFIPNQMKNTIFSPCMDVLAESSHLNKELLDECDSIESDFYYSGQFPVIRLSSRIRDTDYWWVTLEDPKNLSSLKVRFVLE